MASSSSEMANSGRKLAAHSFCLARPPKCEYSIQPTKIMTKQPTSVSSTDSRRSFLRKGLAAGALLGTSMLGVNSLQADTREDSLKKYGGFKMGIQSYSLRGFGVDGALDKVQELELHWIEFFRGHYPVTPDREKIAEMQAKLKAHDLSITSHGVQSFRGDEKENRNMFQFAQWSGIKNISADPSKEAFPILHDLVQEFDIRIAIHNHGPGASYDKAQQTFDAVQKWDKRIGFCADLGHYIRSGEDPVKVIHLLGDRLYGVHLKDFAEQKKQTEGVILGQGHLDLLNVFRALKAVKFPSDGALSLEYEENPKDPMADIRECLDVAAKAAQRVAAEG